jgi:hypothetical protein
MASEKEKIIQDMQEIVGLRNALLVADYIISRDKKRRGEDITIEALRANPLYGHINIDHEFAKARQWIVQKGGGRKLTPRFFVNWLNNIEKPLDFVEKKCQIQTEAF